MKVNILKVRTEENPKDDPLAPTTTQTTKDDLNKASFIADSKDLTDLFEKWGLTAAIPTEQDEFFLGSVFISQQFKISYNAVEIIPMPSGMYQIILSRKTPTSEDVNHFLKK